MTYVSVGRRLGMRNVRDGRDFVTRLSIMAYMIALSSLGVAVAGFMGMVCLQPIIVHYQKEAQADTDLRHQVAALQLEVDALSADPTEPATCAP